MRGEAGFAFVCCVVVVVVVVVAGVGADVVDTLGVDAADVDVAELVDGAEPRQLALLGHNAKKTA